MKRSFVLTCVAVAFALPLAAAAQTAAEQVSAQGFGPVALAGGDRLDVCVANTGEAVSRSSVRIFELGEDRIRAVAKHDPELTSGKSACYKYSPKTAAQVMVVLAGDPRSGWDISDRNLITSVQVVNAGAGKARVVLAPVPKVVSTSLLQK